MKTISWIILIATILMMTGCASNWGLQISDDADPYMKLPTTDGASYVTCNTATDCTNYLNANRVFDLNVECREKFCYFEDLGKIQSRSSD